MAITNLFQSPDQFTPSSNGAVFLFGSPYSGQQTFSYIVDVSINDVWTQREKVAPDPGSGLLLWDAKSVAGYLTNEPVTASTTMAVTPAINTVQKYELYVGVAYSYMTYSAITNSGGIQFSLNVIHTFGVGDFVTINANATDSLNEYSGRRQITAVPNNTTITIGGSLTSTPADQTGRIGLGTGQPIIISGITPASNFYQWKAALPRSEYFQYDQDTVRVGNSNAKLGTNMPRSGYAMRTNGRMWLFNPISANNLFMTITTYDQGGTVLGIYQFANPYDVATTKAVYSRCGPMDITDAQAGATVVSGSTPIITDSVAYYTAQWRGGSPSYLAKSDAITVYMDRSQNGPECPVQLLFQDQHGSYITALCAPSKKVSKKTSVQTYKTRGFDLSANAPNYITDQTRRQHTVFAVDLEESFSTYAILKSKDDAQFFSELFTSSDVYEIQEDGGLLPVVVFEGTRTAVNPYQLKGPIKWLLEYSYAFDQPLNI